MEASWGRSLFTNKHITKNYLSINSNSSKIYIKAKDIIIFNNSLYNKEALINKIGIEAIAIIF